MGVGDAAHSPGGLGIDEEGDAFLRLHAEDQDVVGDLASVGGEEDAGGGFEVDANFRAGLGHALAAAEVEGHAFPAPVIDAEFLRRRRFRFRFAG